MAGVELGTAYINIVSTSQGLGRSIAADLRGAEVAAGAAGAKAGTSFGGGLLAASKKFVAPVAAAFAVVRVGSFLGDAVGRASDLNEEISKSRVVFGEGADAVAAFSDQGAKALGQSKLAALQAATSLGVFGKAAGLQGPQLAQFSTRLTSLAADMGSFNNVDSAEVIDAMGSALRGETEPLSRFGVILNEATLKNRALQMGLIATTKDALTPQQKVLAVNAEIWAQTGDQQGDLAKTSGSLANQQRQLSSEFENVTTSIGEKLLPVFTKILRFVNDHLIPAFGWLGERVADVFGFIGDVISFVWENVIKPVFEKIKGAITSVIDFFSNFGEHLDKFKTWISEAFTNVLNWFAELPRRIWDAVVAVGGKLVALGAWIIKQIVSGLGDLVAGAWDFLKWISGKVWDGLTGLITLGAQAIGWVVTGLGQGFWDFVKWLGEMVSKAWEGIKGVGRRIGSAIADGVKEGLIVPISDKIKSGGQDFLLGKSSNIFGFASGGYVEPSPGGSIVRMAEAGKREWAIPDPLLKQVVAYSGSAGSGGGKRQIGENVYINAGVTVDEVRHALNESLRRVPMYA